MDLGLNSESIKADNSTSSLDAGSQNDTIDVFNLEQVMAKFAHLLTSGYAVKSVKAIEFIRTQIPWPVPLVFKVDN